MRRYARSNGHQLHLTLNDCIHADLPGFILCAATFIQEALTYMAISGLLTPEGNFILFNFDVDKFTGNFASMAITGFTFTFSYISAATISAASFLICKQ